MNNKIAIPMKDGKLCPHFGHCEYFSIVTVENNQITDVKELIPPEHEPGLYPRWVAQQGTTDVIAGGMGQKAIDLFSSQNLNVIVGAPQKDAKSIVEDFIAGKLNLNDNYCSKQE